MKIKVFLVILLLVSVAGCCLFSSPYCRVGEFTEGGCCKIIEYSGEPFWVYGRGSAQLGRIGYKERAGKNHFVNIKQLNISSLKLKIKNLKTVSVNSNELRKVSGEANFKQFVEGQFDYEKHGNKMIKVRCHTIEFINTISLEKLINSDEESVELIQDFAKGQRKDPRVITKVLVALSREVTETSTQNLKVKLEASSKYGNPKLVYNWKENGTTKTVNVEPAVLGYIMSVPKVKKSNGKWEINGFERDIYLRKDPDIRSK